MQPDLKGHGWERREGRGKGNERSEERGVEGGGGWREMGGGRNGGAEGGRREVILSALALGPTDRSFSDHVLKHPLTPPRCV
jgi:hypothetical protein